MEFDPPLIEARLLRRYKRFLADVRLPSGAELTVHTPNTGAMHGCAIPGHRVWLRDSRNPKRKHRYSWVLSEGEGGALVGVDTGAVNVLVAEAIDTGLIGPLQGYEQLRGEVRYGLERSRIDLLLTGHAQLADAYVEIKNVTAVDATGCGYFPDAVTTRGQKHLRELMQVVAAGWRGVLLFCVQRDDLEALRPADEVDPAYGTLLRQAAAAGVELLAYCAQPTPEAIRLYRPLPIRL